MRKYLKLELFFFLAGCYTSIILSLFYLVADAKENNFAIFTYWLLATFIFVGGGAFLLLRFFRSIRKLENSKSVVNALKFTDNL